MSMFEMIRDIVNFRSRAKGTTTALVSAALANPKAVLFVENGRMRHLIERMYPALVGRVVSVFGISDFCSRSFDGPLLFDKEAVVELMRQMHKEGVEQGKKQQVEMQYTGIRQEVVFKLPEGMTHDQWTKMVHDLRTFVTRHNIMAEIKIEPKRMGWQETWGPYKMGE